MAWSGEGPAKIQYFMGDLETLDRAELLGLDNCRMRQLQLDQVPDRTPVDVRVCTTPHPEQLLEFYVIRPFNTPEPTP